MNMTEVNQPNQELFDYLATELNVIATQAQMQEIEAIVIREHEQEIKDAYNQGYRDASIITLHRTERIEDTQEAQNYYNETFNK